MKGKLWGVGVGPGDSELMTLKAVRIIKECDVLAVPQTSGDKNAALDIVSKAMDLSEKKILFLPFLMVKDKEAINSMHERNAEKIAEVLIKGKTVAFITLGDVSVFSTFSYIQKKVEEMGFETEVCAGVPSFCAVAARVKTSLTTMKEPLHIIPAVHSDIDELLKLKGTKVFMKAGTSLKDIKKAVSGDAGIFACGVSNCGMEDETIIYDFEGIGENSGYFTTVIVKEKD